MSLRVHAFAERFSCGLMFATGFLSDRPQDCVDVVSTHLSVPLVRTEQLHWHGGRYGMGPTRSRSIEMLAGRDL